jgi:hypothetical protein
VDDTRSEQVAANAQQSPRGRHRLALFWRLGSPCQLTDCLLTCEPGGRNWVRTSDPRYDALVCQRSLRNPVGWPWFLRAGGHQNSRLVAACSPRRWG